MKEALIKKLKRTSAIQRIAFFTMLLVTLASAVSAVSYFSANASASGELFLTDDGLWYYVWDSNHNDTPTIVGYNGTSTDITFPSKQYRHYVNGQYQNLWLTFRAIDIRYSDYNFFRKIDEAKVTSITIPDNITRIGGYIFRDCTSLTSVTLPPTLNSIGDNAFEGCTSLTSMTLPNSVTYIGSYAFLNCTSLNSINIPTSLTNMGSDIFSNTGFETFTWPGYIDTIPSGAFSHCENLKSVNISYGVKNISSSAFQSCKNLVNVVLPQSLQSLGYATFGYCTSLQTVILPNSVTSFGGQPFSGCTSLTSVTLPKNILTIPMYMFSGCTNLTTVKNTENVTSIEGYAFQNCTSLKTLDMPKLNSLGNYAFENVNIDSLYNSGLFNKLTYASGFAFAKVTATNFEIPSGISRLSYDLFYYAKIDKLTIPSTVNSFSGDYICANTTMNELVWNSQSSIPSGFCKDSSIKKVTVTTNISRIGDGAFSGCKNLSEFNANASIRNIGGSAFLNCSSLTDISNIIKYANTIDFKAFSGTGITKLEINPLASGKLNKGNEIFSNCKNLTEVYWNTLLESSSGYRGQYIFKGCTALETFTFGPNCSSLYNYSPSGPYVGYDTYFFDGCSSLKTVNIERTEGIHGSIDQTLMYNAATSSSYATIYYYAGSNVESSVKSYYNSYSKEKRGSYYFTIKPFDTEPPKSVSSVTIDNNITSMSLSVGETANLPSGTITYSDGSTESADSSNSYWVLYSGSSVKINDDDTVSGISTGTSYLRLYSKDGTKYSPNISITVTSPGGGSTDKPATSVKFNNFYVANTDIINTEYEQGITPFMYVKNNGSSSISARVYVTPGYSSDKLQVEITQGDDILAYRDCYSDSYSQRDEYTLYFYQPWNEDDGYHYGEVTVKVTAGNYSDSFTFELKPYDDSNQSLTGIVFDNASLSKNNLIVGESYTYTAFPNNWWGEDPYKWYEVKYYLSDTNIAELSVADTKNAVTDPNDSSKTYDAYVATVTPKRAGQVKLYAYPAGIKGWAKCIKLTITDPNSQGSSTTRPDQSPNPGEIWATSVRLPSSMTILTEDEATAEGESYKILPTIQPADCNDTLIFYSYDNSIVKVDTATGEMIGLKTGTTTVGVTTSSGLNAEMKVKVMPEKVHTTSITIPETYTIKTGTTRKLDMTLTPEDSTDPVKWTSSNSDTITVDDGGNITAKNAGTATITVASGNFSATCTVTIIASATNITLSSNDMTINHNAEAQLTATLTPADAYSDIKWTSSNSKIATVSDDGLIKGVGYGDVTITAINDEELTAECVVHVVPDLKINLTGAAIRVIEPYGLRFTTTIDKTYGDYKDLNNKRFIVKYGTIILPTSYLDAGEELTLQTTKEITNEDGTTKTVKVMDIQGKKTLVNNNSTIKYTGVMTNIKENNFDRDNSARGYLIYKDSEGKQHTIYTPETASISYRETGTRAYTVYQSKPSLSSYDKMIMTKLEEIFGFSQGSSNTTQNNTTQNNTTQNNTTQNNTTQGGN